MGVFNYKSHEELRLEDYKQLRNNDAAPVASNSLNWLNSSSFAAAPVASNSLNWLNSIRPAATNGPNVVAQDQHNLPQSSSKSNIFAVQDSQHKPISAFPGFQVPYFPPLNTTPSFFRNPSPNASQSTGTSSSVPLTSRNIDSTAVVNYNTQPSAFHYFPAFVSVIYPGGVSYTPLLGTQVSPATMSFGGPTTNVTMHDGPNQTHSNSPASVPGLAIGPFGGPTPKGCHCLNQDHSTAHNSVVSSGIGFCHPSMFVGLSGPNRAQSTTLASVSSPFLGTNSSPTSLFPAPPSSSSTQEANKITSFVPSLHGNSRSNELKPKGAEDTYCVPKGLEIIAEMLGFNPWSQVKDTANKLDSEVGQILPCVDAHKDEDIRTLAEFAVDQHNALHKDDSVTLMKVVAACLEAVGRGRYHIVLDTIFSGPGFKPPKRHYAVVLRKATQRFNNLMVLQQWLPSNP